MPLNQNEAEVLKSTMSGAIDALVTPEETREPLVSETGLVPREWSETISKMMAYSFLSWRQHGGAYPGTSTTRPLSPSEALASYANRPDTSASDYAAVRDHAAELVRQMSPGVQYGTCIPALLAQFATTAAG